jgi:hypothetical protein
MSSRPTSIDVARRILRLAGRVLGDRGRAGGYPGDYDGSVRDLRIDYAPRADGQADAGEVVWAWVPYEEDHRRGKDRPVLVLGLDGPWLVALMLTSTDHDGDVVVDVRSDRAGRRWMDIGTGDWDPRRRPSEVRLDRLLRLDPSAVRREGAALERSLFDRVVKAVITPW